MISSLWKGRFCKENNKFHLSLQLILATAKISFCRKTADAALAKTLQIHVQIRKCWGAFRSCNYRTLWESHLKSSDVTLGQTAKPRWRVVHKAPCLALRGVRQREVGAPQTCAAPRLTWGTPVPQPSRRARKRRMLTARMHVRVFKYSLLGTPGKPTTDILPWDVFSTPLQKSNKNMCYSEGSFSA